MDDGLVEGIRKRQEQLKDLAAADDEQCLLFVIQRQYFFDVMQDSNTRMSVVGLPRQDDAFPFRQRA